LYVFSAKRINFERGRMLRTVAKGVPARSIRPLPRDPAFFAAVLRNSDIKPPLLVVDPERFYRSGEKYNRLFHMCLSVAPKFSIAFVIGFLKGKSAVCESTGIW
jgi:hypothetical protein